MSRGGAERSFGQARGAEPPSQVLGVFAHVDTTVDAIERLKAGGYRLLTVYTPVPVPEVLDAVDRERPLSRVRLFTLVGALSGTSLGFFLTIYSALRFGQVTGGKPIVSIPPYVVIAFELTILLAALSTVLGFLLLSGLPRLRARALYDPRFSQDRWGVLVTTARERADAVRARLKQAGAEEVRHADA